MEDVVRLEYRAESPFRTDPKQNQNGTMNAVIARSPALAG